jgi:hypothetical protein
MNDRTTRERRETPLQTRRLRIDQLDDWLDQALADTFPASDPVATPPGGADAVFGVARPSQAPKRED